MYFFSFSRTLRSYKFCKIQELRNFITFFYINYIYIKKHNNLQKSLLIYFTYINICKSIYILKYVCYNGSMNIRELRISKKITQRQLAEKTGISQQHISKIENGKITPTFITLMKLANALGFNIKFEEEKQ